MKPRLDRFAVVTATINPTRSRPFLQTWRDRARFDWPLYVVWNGCTEGTIDSKLHATLITQPEIGGVVPMFARGVERAIDGGADIIACLHDDVEIFEDGWDARVLSFFDHHPTCGLLGFGGGTGLGDDDMYLKEYDPMSLARKDFVSNMRDADLHGRRSTEPCRVACLDGFSQIGRAEPFLTAWDLLVRLGITHHAYDAALGATMKRLHRDVWMVPILCHHAGGQTAVGDPRYAEWAKTITPDGDAGFWNQAHEAVYEEFADVLPIRA